MTTELESLVRRGLAALDAKRATDAVDAFRRATELAPNGSEHHLNLGVAYRLQGNLDAAGAAFTRAVSLKPDWAEAHFNLAVVLQQLRSPYFTLAFERAAAMAPRNAAIQRGAAAALMRHDELERSLPLWRRAVELDASAENLTELGTNHRLLGDHRSAVDILRQAVARYPNHATALLELGAALMELEELDDAEDALRLALKHAPQSVPALFNLASVLQLLGRAAESVATLRRLLALSPDSKESRSNLLVTLNYDPEATDVDIEREAIEWGKRHAARPASNAVARTLDPSKPLRVGYFAADYGTLSPFMPPLIEHHDRNAFEWCFYSGAPLPEGMPEALAAHGDRFRDVGSFDDEALARLVREDGIDVLVDLTMHLVGSRLSAFAAQPAPVQIAWLAYPGTTGVPAMQFRLTDPHLDPLTAETPYTEASIRLQEAFWPYRPRDPEIAPGDPPVHDNGFVTFGCLNAFSKVNDALLDVWADVLARVVGSRFKLLAPRGRSRDRVRVAFSRKGVDPGRIDFVDRRAHVEYMATYRTIDVCLDTFPCTGHTTSLDAAFMGVPVVTLGGDRIVARGGVSIVRNLGVPELLANSVQEYVDSAVALGRDVEHLKRLRPLLRARMEQSIFMDGPRFCRHLEDAYREAVERVSSG